MALSAGRAHSQGAVIAGLAAGAEDEIVANIIATAEAVHTQQAMGMSMRTKCD